MKAGEMLATISWRQALDFCFTLLTAFCSWPGWLAAEFRSVATIWMAFSTLQWKSSTIKIYIFSLPTSISSMFPLPVQFNNTNVTTEDILAWCSVALRWNITRNLPVVFEHVVHYISGEHVLVDISLHDKQHITQPACQPTPLSSRTHKDKNIWPNTTVYMTTLKYMSI